MSSHLLDGQQQPKLPSPSRTTISRSKIELDMASMIFCRRFVLTSKADWWLHLRADASPQGGRDYFVVEADVCTVSVEQPFNPAANHPISQALAEGRLQMRSRLLPLQVIGCRAASSVHKAKALITSLRLESEDLQLSLDRTATLMFDFGAEAGIWSMPRQGLPDERLFKNSLPIADADHGVHHAPCLHFHQQVTCHMWFNGSRYEPHW